MDLTETHPGVSQAPKIESLKSAPSKLLVGALERL